MKHAKFNELKLGDKLAQIQPNGEVKYYTFLVYNPNYKEKYAYLQNIFGEAEHLYYDDIEKMYLYTDYEEVNEYAFSIKVKWHRGWLKTYELNEKFKNKENERKIHGNSNT